MNYEQKIMLQKSSILTQFPAVWIGIWNVLQSTDICHAMKQRLQSLKQ